MDHWYEEPKRALRVIQGAPPLDDSWTAFCSVHWFLTGQRYVSLSKHPSTHSLYEWWRQNSDTRYVAVTLNYEG